MGINRFDIALLSKLRMQSAIPDGARVAELGAQQISRNALEDRDGLEALGRLFGAALPVPFGPAPAAIIEDGVERLSPDAPPARKLWEWLGLGYTAVEIDEAADVIQIDLNFDSVPPEMMGVFDIVTNYGTTEHVANQLNAFKVMHDLARPGGLMIHHLPAQGHLDHGLINYNPKFFWMLARSNEYRWIYFDYVQAAVSRPAPRNLIESVEPFRPSILEEAPGYRTAEAALIVVLQKDSPAPFVPPVDIPSGTRTSSERLLLNYPSVFKRV
jgi:SAM-dependent methyltransferase